MGLVMLVVWKESRGGVVRYKYLMILIRKEGLKKTGSHTNIINKLDVNPRKKKSNSLKKGRVRII